jgi:hypothetical protein
VTEEPKDEDGKVLQVKHSDFSRIKAEAKAKGRRETIDEYEALAKKAGFSSLEEFFQQQKKIAEPPPAAPVPPKEITAMPTKPTETSVKPEKGAQEAARLSDERTKMRKQWRKEERARRELQRQLDAKEAEMGLREEMYQFGVTDVDYGLRLLTRELAGKSEEEIGAFDRKAFFETVRKERPYLFGERVTQATTGTTGATQQGGTVQPATPKPGEPAVEKAAEQQFDARKATPQQVQDRLKALGLNPHM